MGHHLVGSPWLVAMEPGRSTASAPATRRALPPSVPRRRLAELESPRNPPAGDWGIVIAEIHTYIYIYQYIYIYILVYIYIYVITMHKHGEQSNNG